MKPDALTLAVLLILVSKPAVAASFDCRKAQSPDEKAICADRILNDADVRMATTYELLSGLFAMGMRGAMHDSQQQFLMQRHACGSDIACLKALYRKRIEDLQDIYDHIPKPL